jgi:putative transcriptional regulator
MKCAIQSRLAECLAERKTSKSQLAFRLGLSRAHVTRMAQGDVSPSLGLALKIAKQMGRPVEEIFQLAEDGRQTISRPPSVAPENQQHNHTETKKVK